MKHAFRCILLTTILALLFTCLANLSRAEDTFRRQPSPHIAKDVREGLANFMEAQRDTLTFTYAGSAFWGWFQDVVVSGDYAYCAAYHGLLVMDISDPTDPAVVSRLYVPGRSVWHPIEGGRERSIELSGNYVYMTCQGMGLRIIDISVPEDPVLVGSVDEFSSNNAFWDVRLSGDYAYIAAEQGLVVIDVSTPSDPQVVARPATNPGQNLALYGTVVYMGRGNESNVQVIDISSPESPVVDTTLGFTCIEAYTLGTYAYFMSSGGKILIADIVTPTSPVIVDSVLCPFDFGAACLGGSLLYVGGEDGGGMWYPQGYDTLEVYDLSNPVAPILLDVVTMPSFSYANIAASGSYAYFLAREGLHIGDISGPIVPDIVGEYQQYQIERLSVSGDYGYFHSRDTFYVLDVAVPSDPAVVGQCSMASSASLGEIEIQGDYAYVLLGNCCVQIIDISSPTAPAYVGQIPTSYTDIDLRDTVLYAISGDTLTLFNVVDPLTPSFLGGAIAAGNTFRALSISGDYIIAAGTNNIVPDAPTLVAFDVSNPASPDSAGEYIGESGGPFVLDIQIRGDYAYVLGMPSVFDISDPTNPTPLPGSPMPTPLYDADRELLFGDYLIFVYSWFSGTPRFYVASVSDPANPTMIAAKTTVGFPADAAVKDNYLIIPERTGLVIREMTLTSVGSGYFVSNLNDAGSGSLRSAITGANGDPGADTVIFLVSGIISLSTPLPALTDDSTVILGTSAPGGIHSVILDGSGLVSGHGLEISGSRCTVEGLRIVNFPENGIACTGAGSGNSILSNVINRSGGIAIDLGNDGVTVNDIGDIDTGPNGLLNYPEIDSVVSQEDESYMIYGRAIHDAYVEFFVAHPANDSTRPQDPSLHGEAWAYIGNATASPTGEFVFHDVWSTHFAWLTCTATDSLGNTSEMSENFTLMPAPMVVTAFVYTSSKGGYLPQNGVNIIVEDPNSDRFGRDSLNNTIDEIPDDQYYAEGPSEDTVIIPDPIPGDYIIYIVGEAGSQTGTSYAAIIKTDGLESQVVIIDGQTPVSGTYDSYEYTYDETWEYDYVYGDASGDGICNISDAVYVINYIFKGGPAPDPEGSGDANCDTSVSIADAVYIINYVFKGGPAPCTFGG